MAVERDALRIRCDTCSTPVEPNRDYREVRGWERRRARGGANVIHGRIETGRWLCVNCYDFEYRLGATASML